MRSSATLIAILLMLALAAGVWLTRQPGRQASSSPARPNNQVTLEDPPKRIAPFTLVDENGEPFGRDRLQGHWTLLFVGYTHCPDFCPNTLTALRSAYRAPVGTPRDLTGANVLFISVDPQRDTPAVLKKFICYFDQDFHAASGTRRQIDELAGQLGVIYGFDGDTSGQRYVVHHTTSILAIDPQGRWFARFAPPHSASTLAAGFHWVRTHYRSQQH